MFVTANKNVNIRLNDPQAASPCGGFVPVNTQVEVANILAGQVIDGNSVWYLSTQNQYLWSGGFVQTTDLLTGDDDQPVNLSQDVLMAVYASAVKELTAQFKADFPDDCKGLGFGPTATGLSLFFYADASPQSQPPATINYRGVPLNITVQVTGGITACTIFSDPPPPFFMGGTVSDASLGRTQYGTRTAYIQINNAGQYVLTCFHVACASLMAQSITTFQAGGSVNIPAPVSNSAAVTGQFPVHEGYLDTFSDYAIVNVSGHGAIFQNELPDGIGFINGYYTFDEVPSKLGGIQQLTIFGATSGPTTGKIVQYNAGALAVNYTAEHFGTMQFYGLITANNACLPGDSGAPVLDQNRKLLGYVIAVDNLPGGNCYIMPVGNLFFNDTISLLTPSP